MLYVRDILFSFWLSRNKKGDFVSLSANEIRAARLLLSKGSTVSFMADFLLLLLSIMSKIAN